MSPGFNIVLISVRLSGRTPTGIGQSPFAKLVSLAVAGNIHHRGTESRHRGFVILSEDCAPARPGHNRSRRIPFTFDRAMAPAGSSLDKPRKNASQRPLAQSESEVSFDFVRSSQGELPTPLRMTSFRESNSRRKRPVYATAPAASAAGPSATIFPGPCPMACASACSARLITSVTTSAGS